MFANPMATAAAIDRIVHHSVILGFDKPNYRIGEAQERQLNPTLSGQNKCRLPRRANLMVNPDGHKGFATGLLYGFATFVLIAAVAF